MKYMRMFVAALMLAVVLNAQQRSGKDQAAAAFDLLKSLSGDWVGTTVESGKEMSALITFRLASGGSVLMSDLAPGMPHEMITMFHRDGEALLATHYCLTGNQPRMRAVASVEPNVVAFKFKDATNLSNPAAPHMSGVKFTVLDANHHVEDWTILVNGQISVRKFDCHRKQ